MNLFFFFSSFCFLCFFAFCYINFSCWKNSFIFHNTTILATPVDHLAGGGILLLYCASDPAKGKLDGEGISLYIYCIVFQILQRESWMEEVYHYIYTVFCFRSCKGKAGWRLFGFRPRYMRGCQRRVYRLRSQEMFL